MPQRYAHILILFNFFWMCYAQIIKPIIDGEDIPIEKVPYQASLRGKGLPFCGGSIISKDVILTAAHCLYEYRILDLSVQVGSNSTRIGGTIVGVRGRLRHPGHVVVNVTTVGDHDIGLVFLTEPLVYSNTIQPIQMVAAGEITPPGTLGLITGYGFIHENGPFSYTLKGAWVPVMSREQCQADYAGHRNITPTMLCAGYQAGGQDTCKTDSGGPLVSSTGKLIGVSSWGRGCGRPHSPGVYAHVALLRTWVDENISSIY